MKEIALLTLFLCISSGAAQAAPVPNNRVASILVSQDFINEQLALHVKSELIESMSTIFDPDQDQIYLRGIIQVPLEELRAINLDPKLGKFRFQVTVRLQSTTQGHLILEFPLNETYFYPATSKDNIHERIIVPVQMLSLALASVRGYLAALSGDFAGFDRRTKKLEALVKALDREIEHEKNPDAVDDLKNQRDSLRLKLAAVPIERKELKGLSKEVENVLGFTGEKELSLNNELSAHNNALILKIKLSQIIPYLEGIELGGVRIIHDKKDGAGQNYMAIDINNENMSALVPASVVKPADRVGMKVAPSLMVRLNQSLFESAAVLDVEKKSMGNKIKDFDLELKDDGLHVSGKYHALLLSIPFDTIVDFVSTGTDVFEVRVREMKFAGVDVEFLSKFVLESIKKRLDQSLKGICAFKYAGEENGGARVLQVSVDPVKLVPAFPNLHLVDVDVREHEFLLKVGKI